MLGNQADVAARTVDSTATVMDLGAEATRRGEWWGSIWNHRSVIWILIRKDFHVRYKRATLGVLWAVAVPLLQATVLVVVFSKVVRVPTDIPYGAFVLGGILAWGYFAAVMPIGATAIVDGASLTDKIWFPRAILAFVPCMSGLVGLGVSMMVLLVAGPAMGGDVSLRLLLLIPGCALLIAFTVAVTLVLSALQVYFRDVRFIASAGLLVWIYLTPIVYPKEIVGRFGPWLDANPLTGIVSIFQVAMIGPHGAWGRAVAVSVAATLLLLVIGVELQRRYDRVFVDQL